jgi:hypothetical protein
VLSLVCAPLAAAASFTDLYVLQRFAEDLERLLLKADRLCDVAPCVLQCISTATEAMQNQPLTPSPGMSPSQTATEHPAGSSITLSIRSASVEGEKKLPPSQAGIPKVLRHLSSFKFKEDYRARLPLNVSRFLGYRPSLQSTYDALPIFPFTLLNRISLKHEAWIFAFFGSLGSILLIEAAMSCHTAFQVAYHSPLIISSFGASAVLVFGVIESPLSQPRNLVLGHFVSGLIGVAMTRLWVRNGSYDASLENAEFYAPAFINGGLCMSVSLVALLVLGVLHPPGGASGLAAATQRDVILLSWHYLPVLVASSAIMLGWAMIINNVGRRRYPLYWWSPETCWVIDASENSENHKLEEGVLCVTRGSWREPETFHVERVRSAGYPGVMSG